MARQTINLGTIANDRSGDTMRQGGQKINDNFSELYAILGGDTLTVGNNPRFTDSGLDFPGVSHTLKIGYTEPASGEQKITFPNTTGTVVTNNATQTLTNKTLTSPTITSPTITGLFLNDGSIVFEGATPNDYETTLTATDPTADRTITLPDATTTLVGTDVTQTLTNKSLIRPRIRQFLGDSSGLPLLRFTSAVSAVNHVHVTSAATGSYPVIKAHGTDTNIGIQVLTKGTGPLRLSGALTYQDDPITSTTPTLANHLSTPLSVFNPGSTATASMPNGLYTGHTKVYINKSASNVVINASSSNIGPWASITLAQWGTVQLIWDGADWHVLSNSSQTTLA